MFEYNSDTVGGSLADSVLLELVVVVLGGLPAVVGLVDEVLHEALHLRHQPRTFSSLVGIFLQKAL